MGYFENPGISRSALVELLSSPKRAGEVLFEKMQPKYFEIGTMVDTLLTRSSEFFTIYKIGEHSKPTAGMGDLAHNILLLAKEKGEITQEIILEARQIVDYDKRLTTDTLMNKVNKDALPWITEQLENEDKFIIDAQDFALSNSIVSSILSLEASNRPFVNPNTKFQLELYWKYQGEDCKAMLDAATFDDERMIIYPYDVKTTSYDPRYFPSVARKDRHDIQAAWYTFGLEEVYPEYTIAPFQFIVETTKKERVGFPLVFECSCETLSAGRFGTVRTPRSNEYTSGDFEKGFEQLFVELLFHRNNNLWDYSYEEYQKNQVLLLELWK